MLHRRVISIPLLLLFLTTTGCTLFRFIDYSSPEEMQKFHTSKDDLWNQTKALEKENAVYKKQLADQQAEIDRMNRDLFYWQTETAQADRRVLELNKTVEDLNAQMKQRPEAGQNTPAPPNETGKETNSEHKDVKIKVLAGDGKIASANRISKKLRGMGYRVMRIDRAPRSDFKGDTIFFGPGLQTTAATLAKKLGEDAVTKPLNWPSVFNIIIITGSKS